MTFAVFIFVVMLASFALSQGFCRICDHWGHSECYNDCEKCPVSLNRTKV